MAAWWLAALGIGPYCRQRKALLYKWRRCRGRVARRRGRERGDLALLLYLLLFRGRIDACLSTAERMRAPFATWVALLAWSVLGRPSCGSRRAPFLQEVDGEAWVIGNELWNMTQGRQYGVKLYYKDHDCVGDAVGHYVSYSESAPVRPWIGWKRGVFVLLTSGPSPTCRRRGQRPQLDVGLDRP